MTEIPGISGYAANATALAALYESITFEAVHRDMLHLFPTPPATVLDIGAGSGRDAAALARRGHPVVAVEPTVELRREGQRLHCALTIEWVDHHLPALPALARRRFDLILLTAVWMQKAGGCLVCRRRKRSAWRHSKGCPASITANAKTCWAGTTSAGDFWYFGDTAPAHEQQRESHEVTLRAPASPAKAAVKTAS